MIHLISGFRTGLAALGFVTGAGPGGFQSALPTGRQVVPASFETAFLPSANALVAKSHATQTINAFTRISTPPCDQYHSTAAESLAELLPRSHLFPTDVAKIQQRRVDTPKQ